MAEQVPSKDVSSERLAELIEDRQRFVSYLEAGGGDPDLDDALNMARDLVTALQKLQRAENEPPDVPSVDPIARVINNNQPGWTNIVETAPNVTLDVGAPLYSRESVMRLAAALAGAIDRAAQPPRAKPRDLQSLCDRLGEMFNTDDTPDELSQEAREAIEELWQERDAPNDEIGWLVEAARTDGPQRYRAIEQGMPEWTTDPNKAIRFARRVDAEMYCAEDEDAWHVVEHMWPALTKGAWQSMTTAPKDGREVLLRVKVRAGIPGKCLVGHYMGGGHCIEDHPPISAGWYFWNGCMFDRAADPTDWMPLPDERSALETPATLSPSEEQSFAKVFERSPRRVQETCPEYDTAANFARSCTVADTVDKECSYCFGEGAVSMSTGYERRMCTLCNGTGRISAQPESAPASMLEGAPMKVVKWPDIPKKPSSDK